MNKSKRFSLYIEGKVENGVNFLAHLYLSGTDPELKIGNFIGDFVKGRELLNRFPQGIVRGIELHRAIDEYTDKHPVVMESKKRLRPKYRHYAGVIVDIFYDHFLAVNWHDYHHEFLPDYAESCYDLLQQHDLLLPEEVKFMLPYMIKGNWLVNYARIEGVHRALTGMSRRTKYDSKMEEASHDLVNYYEDFKQEFTVFFPQLRQFASTFP